jgi:ubiquitin carboxyl-terminal hydrolase 4/11
MDPQSLAFTPRDDFWRFQSEMLRVQQTQADHGERLSRLERRQDEDARVKSVWGASSPFPSVLTGTPQQGQPVLVFGGTLLLTFGS